MRRAGRSGWLGTPAAALALGVACAATAVTIEILPGPDMRPAFSALRHVPGDPDAAAPIAVSDDGSVVIANGVSIEGGEAFRWTFHDAVAGSSMESAQRLPSSARCR